MILSTDSGANLPKNYYQDLNIEMIPLLVVKGDEIFEDLSEKLPNEKFYDDIRSGENFTTSQINEQRAKEYFEGLLARGEDILHIGFSSALSGTTANMQRVADELNGTHANKIIVVDSLNAAAGQGILVLKAHDMMQQGKSIDEVAAEIKASVPNICSYFTVEQLKYLVRGGRLSKVSGVVGSILNIKPVLRVDEQGKLTSYKKVVSRKKSINEIANICEEKIKDKKYVFINHADSLADAQALAAIVKERLGVEPVIADITQVIGCHTGPGLIALFFEGKVR